jgi:hypothetical protein
MPKSKHRWKAGGKAVPYPSRQRAEPPGWAARHHHRPDDAATGGLSQPAPPAQSCTSAGFPSRSCRRRKEEALGHPPIQTEAEYDAALAEVRRLWGVEVDTPDGDRQARQRRPAVVWELGVRIRLSLPRVRLHAALGLGHQGLLFSVARRPGQL